MNLSIFLFYAMSPNVLGISEVPRDVRNLDEVLAKSDTQLLSAVASGSNSKKYPPTKLPKAEIAGL